MMAKLKDINKVPKPAKVWELECFLDMENYLHKCYARLVEGKLTKNAPFDGAQNIWGIWSYKNRVYQCIHTDILLSQ